MHDAAAPPGGFTTEQLAAYYSLTATTVVIGLELFVGVDMGRSSSKDMVNCRPIQCIGVFRIPNCDRNVICLQQPMQSA